MSQRGVLYIKWGTELDPLLERSMHTLKIIHPELPVHVKELPAGSTLHDKAKMFDYSPFEHTLFLDLDTIVLGRLDYAFERARRHKLAAAICENPWARRHADLAREGDLVEYNTGVLFFTREAEPVFKRWEYYAPRLDATTKYFIKSKNNEVDEQKHDDQASFAKAVDDLRMPPYVLPNNWNLRPVVHKLFFGPVKIWHNYPPPSAEFLEWNRQQMQPGAIIDIKMWT